jgi:hypothetical protein
MRKLLVLLSLLAVPLAFSKEQKDYATLVRVDVYCFKLDALKKEIEKKYGEDPIVIGKSSLEEGTATVVYVSQQTGTYTIIESDGEVGCVLATGTNVRYRMPKALERKML